MSGASPEDQEMTAGALAAPGDMLRQAREAAALTRARVAAELGMTETAVREIEENHFGKFAAGIYVRGYLKNYGKLLGLDESRLLTAYDHFCVETGLAQTPNQCGKKVMTAEDRRQLVGSSIILVALGGVGLLIWMASL